MRVPIRGLNFSRPGTRHHRDNLVRVEQARTYVLSRIVPLAELDQRHYSSLRILIVSFITLLDTSLLSASFKAAMNKTALEQDRDEQPVSILVFRQPALVQRAGIHLNSRKVQLKSLTFISIALETEILCRERDCLAQFFRHRFENFGVGN
jgi:hypothetical protein